MFDWLGLSSIYGMCFLILPVLYFLRRLFKVRKQKKVKEQLMKIEAAVAAQTPVIQSQPHVDNSRKINVDVAEMKSAVDLINFQLILIESKVYKNIEPVPPLSMDEFTAAFRQLEYMKTKTLPCAIAELSKD